MITEQRLYAIEDKIRKLYCCLKDSGGGNETDPVFRASVAFTITQADIDKWNTGGSGGNYVPLDGMNLQAGERMKPDFLLANYDILTEIPPANSIAVGMSNDLGGFVYQGSSTNNGLNYNGSFNATPTNTNATAQLTGSNGNYYSNNSISASNINFNTNGASPDGNYNGNVSFSTSVNAFNKSTALQFNVNGYDNLNSTNFYYGLTLDQLGVRFDGLPNAQGDVTFTKQIVVRPDGYIGIENKPAPPSDELTQILGNINGENVPTGISLAGFVFKKSSTFTIHLRDTAIQRNTARTTYQYLGDVSSAYGVKCPFEVMFPCTITVVDTNNNVTYHPSTGVVYQSQLYVYLPQEAMTITNLIGIIAYFQFTNTNTAP